MSTKSKFYVTQSVLCRNTHREYWKLDFFVAENEGFDFPYICAIKRWKQCIPLHGNEKYLRTAQCHKKFPKKAVNGLKLNDDTTFIQDMDINITFSGTMQIKSK